MEYLSPQNVVNRTSLVCCLLVSSMVSHAQAIDYDGSLTLPSGITGVDDWDGGPATLSWNAVRDEFNSETYYSYVYEHPATSYLEFILEVSPALVELGRFVDDPASTLENYELGYFAPGASKPGMPDSIPGIRFWGETSATTQTFRFATGYAPGWGDFYSTNGMAAAAWNTGFTEMDTDPSDFPGNGSIDSHLLKPSGDIELVPVPAAVWLFASGLLGLVGMARSKRIESAKNDVRSSNSCESGRDRMSV